VSDPEFDAKRTEQSPATSGERLVGRIRILGRARWAKSDWQFGNANNQTRKSRFVLTNPISWVLMALNRAQKSLSRLG